MSGDAVKLNELLTPSKIATFFTSGAFWVVFAIIALSLIAAILSVSF